MGNSKLGQASKYGRVSICWNLPIRSGAIVGLMVLGIAGCGVQPPSPTPTPSPTAAVPSPSPSPTIAASSSPSPEPSPTPSPTVSQTVKPSPAAQDNVTVQIYQLDDRCENYVSKAKQFPKQDTLEAVVGDLLRDSNSTDFSVASYRVKQEGAIATIDLRLAPDAQRTFVSMSSCEQMAFFGSISKTLTSYAPWKIQDVKFTDGKEEIIL
ncbi:MAG: hypothetical protein VKJ24_16635 [Synechococcales bacterium]|nr:hypothetical protein [Synechococcales bacterium]